MLGLASRGFSLRDYDMHLVRWLSKHGYRTALSGIQHEAPDGNVIGYDEVLLEPVEKNMYVKDPEAFDHKALSWRRTTCAGRRGGGQLLPLLGNDQHAPRFSHRYGRHRPPIM